MLVDAIDHVGGPGLGGPGTVSQSLARAVRLDPHRANEAAQLEVTSVVARSALATNTALAMQPQACVQLERSRCVTPLAMSATAQIRQLRSSDGVYFTKPGARKLAHNVEREITRLLAARTAPVPLPTEPPTPDANAVPGQPVPRPMAGPIVPLVDFGTDQLLGGPGSPPAAVDTLAARTLVKGEALTPPAGRADDFASPRREAEREQATGYESCIGIARGLTQCQRPGDGAGGIAKAEKASPLETGWLEGPPSLAAATRGGKRRAYPADVCSVGRRGLIVSVPHCRLWPIVLPANFRPKNETSDNRRLIGPQTRYQNRL